MEEGLLVGVDVRKDRVLGSGAFGVVYEGTYARTPVAIKSIRPSSPEQRKQLEDALVQEARVWSKIQHPNIVQFFGLHKEMSGDHDDDRGVGGEGGEEQLFLVSELMDGSLLDLLQAEAEREEEGEQRLLSEATLLAACGDIACAMEHLTRVGVIHGDLAARNVLYRRERDGTLVFKVADFGLACFGGKAAATLSYSLIEREQVPVRWCAPEVLKRGQYSEASDVWSAAVVFWEVFSLGELPFGMGVSNQAVVRIVTTACTVLLDKPALCPNEVFGLMVQCWSSGRKQRLSFADLRKSFDRMRGNAPATELPPPAASPAAGSGVVESGNRKKEEDHGETEVNLEDGAKMSPGEIVQTVGLAKQGMENKDYVNAALLFLKAAHADNPLAQGALGLMYLEGKGVEKDLDEAFRWLWAGACAQDGPAMRGLATMYLEGWKVEKDEVQGAILMQQAHERGDPGAVVPLAELYLEGRGVEVNALKATALVTAPGVPQEDEALYVATAAFIVSKRDWWVADTQIKAYTTLNMLSDKGHVKAAFTISAFPPCLRYIEYRIRRRHHLEVAANGGLAEAQYRMAALCKLSEPEEAKRWLRMAAAQGHTEAGTALSTPGMDSLEALETLDPSMVSGCSIS